MNRLIKLPEVKHLTGKGRSAIYREMKEGSFPKNLSLGGSSRGWRESDVQDWITKQILAAGMEA